MANRGPGVNCRITGSAYNRAILSSLYRSSFPRVTAALYGGGALFHLIRVLTGFSPTDIPYLVDWIVAIGAGYGGVGFLVYFRELVASLWRRVATGIMILHLLASVALHVYILAVGSHSVLSVFPLAYSAVAFFAFLGFAWLALSSQLEAAAPASM